MNITFITMFNEPINAWLSSSIIARAQKQEIFSARIKSILLSVANHHAVDDTPYGGGPGELMRIDVIAPLINQALQENSHICHSKKRVLLMDPAGKVFTHKDALRLSTYQELIFVCGRYEGIDARVHHFVDEALSVGDFVLSSGDVAAIAMCDATLRMLDGVLHNPDSITNESHANGRLESSHFTRPANYEGLVVPEVLQNGHHQAIAKFRAIEALQKTRVLRPDLLDKYPLTPDEKKLLAPVNTNGVTYPWMKTHDPDPL